MKKRKVALKILDAQFLDFNTGNELLDTALFILVNIRYIIQSRLKGLNYNIKRDTKTFI